MPCNFRRTVNHVIPTLLATCVDIGSRLASGKNLEFLSLVPKSVLHSSVLLVHQVKHSSLLPRKNLEGGGVQSSLHLLKVTY